MGSSSSSPSSSSQAITSPSRLASHSNTGGTAQGDVIIYLDSNEIEDRIPGWEAMEASVEIEFLGRGISNVLNQKHWAWLIKGRTFFCTIEYGNQGIVIQYFKKNRGINTACAAIMGDSKWVYYDNKFQTSMTFDRILQYVDSIKASWTASDYHSTENNCRDFVRTLGKKMTSTFSPPDAMTNFVINSLLLGLVDCTFPDYRTVA